MRVAFMCYDQEIHFFTLKNSLGQPQRLTVSDLADVFVPDIEQFFVTVDQASAAIDT